MKKITLFLFLLVLSQTVLAKTKLTETQKLAATCKVWGYLKYYHPKVADGSKNWEEQLFTILPQVEKAQTKEEFSLVLENWIDGLGEVKKIAPIILPANVEFFDKNFDLSWMNNNKLFAPTLSKKLKFIEENRYQSNEEFEPGFDGLKTFKNYYDLDFNKKESWFLMVFAYWNLIEYYFPYKYIMDQKWDKTLEQILPLVVESKDQKDFLMAMKKMTTKINDSHGYFIGASKYTTKSRFFPANCKIIDNKMVVTEIVGDSLAQAGNIKIGTVITRINDKTIKELIEENRDLICASNEPAYLDRVAKAILVSDSENVKVEFFKDGKYETKAMTWFDYHDSHRNEFKKGAMKKKEKFKLLDSNIGYVNMGEL